MKNLYCQNKQYPVIAIYFLVRKMRPDNLKIKGICPRQGLPVFFLQMSLSSAPRNTYARKGLFSRN